jgi:hypothetical protein
MLPVLPMLVPQIVGVEAGDGEGGDDDAGEGVRVSAELRYCIVGRASSTLAMLASPREHNILNR